MYIKPNQETIYALKLYANGAIDVVTDEDSEYSRLGPEFIWEPKEKTYFDFSCQVENRRAEGPIIWVERI